MKLDLSYQRLKELPSDFFQQYKYLEEINIRGNPLSKLPPEIAKLKTLKKLTLDGNNLTYLPPEIGQFINYKNSIYRKIDSKHCHPILDN
jgi:Leucine-rich repeat (LRR) protein